LALTALRRIPAKKFTKFASVKASGAAINFSLLYILTDIVGFWYIASAIIATLLVTTYNYLLNNAWTFKDKSHTEFERVTGGIRYALTSWSVIPVYMGLLYLLTDICNIWYSSVRCWLAS